MSFGNSVFIITSGKSGSGKTYKRAGDFLTREWIPDHEGVHWSNFPLGPVPEQHTFPPAYEGETFVDRIAEECHRRHKVPKDVTCRRIQMIPQGELDAWLAKTRGPWDFFTADMLSGSHLALDEIHNFVSRAHPAAWRHRWAEWLGEIRHAGATVEFLSQHMGKVAVEIIGETAVRYELRHGDSIRDAIFRIPKGDWRQLRKAFRLPSVAKCYLYEKHEFDGRFRTMHTRPFVLRRKGFRFYDTNSAPFKQANVKGKSAIPIAERKGPIGVVLWFLSRNFYELGKRGLVIAVFAYFLFGGGGELLWNQVMGSVTGIFGDNLAAPIRIGDDEAPEEPPAPAPPSLFAPAPAEAASTRSTSPAPAPAPAPPPAPAAALLPPMRPASAWSESDAALLAATQALEEAAAAAAERSERVTQLEDELLLANAAADAASAALAEAEARDALAAELVMLQPDRVHLRGGAVLLVGEVVPLGPLSGAVLESIQPTRQRAAFRAPDESIALVPLSVRVPARFGGGLQVGAPLPPSPRGADLPLARARDREPAPVPADPGAAPPGGRERGGDAASPGAAEPLGPVRPLDRGFGRP